MPELRRHLHHRGAALLAGAALLFLLGVIVFPTVATSSGGGADAALVSVGGSGSGIVSVTPSKTDNTATSSALSSLSAVSYSAGTATVSSFVRGQKLISLASVALNDVNLLDGRVTVDAVRLEANAAATRSSATARLDATIIAGLAIDGESKDASGGPFTIDGVGTLTLLAATTTPSGTSASAQVSGLELRLTAAVGDLPAGTVITVGHVAARADTATLDTLVPSPTPSPTPSHTTHPSPRPSHTASTTPYTQPSTPATSPTYTPMPAPATPTADILARFPGAVFPVVGTFTYSDDFGAYRPDIPSHAHEGNDIFAAYGSPIVAVQDGVLTGVSTTSIGGNNIHLTTSRGDYFYYAHLSRFAGGITQGVSVKAGQTIGYVGTTGDAQGTSPHCHFEIHPDGGAAIDPFPYLNAWRAAGSAITTATAAAAPAASGSPLSTADVQLDKRGSASDPALASTLQQVATGLAALDQNLAVDAGHAPTPQPNTVGYLLTALSSVGLVVIKRLQWAAVLLG